MTALASRLGLFPNVLALPAMRRVGVQRRVPEQAYRDFRRGHRKGKASSVQSGNCCAKVSVLASARIDGRFSEALDRTLG